MQYVDRTSSIPGRCGARAVLHGKQAAWGAEHGGDGLLGLRLGEGHGCGYELAVRSGAAAEGSPLQLLAPAAVPRPGRAQKITAP